MTSYTVNINNINNRKEIEFENNKGEKVLMWVYTQKRENSFMDKWVQQGYLEKPLSEFFWVEVYVYDQLGFCWGKYNPMTDKHHQINFDYILDANENNLYKLINKCIELSNEDEVYTDEDNFEYKIVRGGILLRYTFGECQHEELHSFEDLEGLHKQDKICKPRELSFFEWKYLGYNNILNFRKKEVV